MRQGISILGVQQCPQCKGQEFKRFKPSSSVVYYMPITYEEQIHCARCHWRHSGQNASSNQTE
jgi:hypothetical protein